MKEDSGVETRDATEMFGGTAGMGSLHIKYGSGFYGVQVQSKRPSEEKGT